MFCSGKVYYDLYEAREAAGIGDVYIVRLEQLYPFASNFIAELLSRFPSADIVWCQEEPKNMGAWTFVEPRLEEVAESIGRKGLRIKYAGRSESASTATGLLSKHIKEQKALVNEALTV